MAAARSAACIAQTLRHCATLPHWPNRGDHAVQFSAQSRCAQGRARHSVRLHRRAETRAAGALSVLPMSNETAAALVRDDRLKMLSFTGSAAVGWALKQQAGKKRIVLELGGNAGVIVHNDANLTHAASRCVVGGFSYQGQS